MARNLTVIDPRLRPLTKSGREIDGFRLSGFMVELGLKRSLKLGLGMFGAADLPPLVEMRIDGLGSRKLQTYEEDRILACRMVQFVRQQLIDHKVNVHGACVPDSGGEHDLIGDRLAGGAPLRGLVSIEVKCRRLWSEAGCGGSNISSSNSSALALPLSLAFWY